MRAFQWPRSNNKYCRHIQLHQGASDQLPEDGELTGHCVVSAEDDCDGEEKEQSPAEEDTDPCDTASFIPAVARKKTEEETIRETVQQAPSSQLVIP